jgi:hypothetical protein
MGQKIAMHVKWAELASKKEKNSQFSVALGLLDLRTLSGACERGCGKLIWFSECFVLFVVIHHGHDTAICIFSNFNPLNTKRVCFI